MRCAAQRLVRCWQGLLLAQFTSSLLCAAVVALCRSWSQFLVHRVTAHLPQAAGGAHGVPEHPEIFQQLTWDYCTLNRDGDPSGVTQQAPGKTFCHGEQFYTIKLPQEGYWQGRRELPEYQTAIVQKIKHHHMLKSFQSPEWSMNSCLSFNLKLKSRQWFGGPLTET